MDSRFWMLAPWALFAAAAGVKTWRIRALMPRHLLGTPTSTEGFRKSLERIWAKDQQTVDWSA